MITGVTLFALVIGICELAFDSLQKRDSGSDSLDSYTLHAVAQDDFSDVSVPDAPAQPPHSPHTGVERSISVAALNKQKEERLASRNTRE